MSKRTVYNHFQSKQDLLLAVLEEDLKQWIEETRAIVHQRDLEMGERFLRVQRRAVAALQQRAAIFPAPVAGRRLEMRKRTESRFVRGLASLFAEMVEQAKRSGYLLPDVDPQLMSHVLINMGARIVEYCTVPDVPYNATKLLNESLRMVLGGVLTELGRRRLDEIGFAPDGENEHG